MRPVSCDQQQPKMLSKQTLMVRSELTWKSTAAVFHHPLKLTSLNMHLPSEYEINFKTEPELREVQLF